MNREIFFAHIRREPFSGTIKQSQVDGLNALLTACDNLDVRWTAYILATVFHETGARMQPVREGLKTSDKAARAFVKRQGYEYAEPDPLTGEVYYGRGHVQLTWAKNYLKLGEAMGVGGNLFYKPDLALEPGMSVRILLLGMTNGLYTGKSLGDYFSATKSDPVGARRIVNGTDRAGLIAGYYNAFLNAIQAANAEGVPNEHTLPEEHERVTPAPRYPEDPKPLSQSRTIAGQATAATGTAGTAVVTEMQGDTVGDTLNQAQGAASMLSDVLEWAKWIFIALVIAGIAWTIYARWDDARKGKR
jgi:hypothetical protein